MKKNKKAAKAEVALATPETSKRKRSQKALAKNTKQAVNKAVSKMTEKSEMSFVLEGNVFVVETLNGKEISKNEIPGEAVLQCLISALKKAIGE